MATTHIRPMRMSDLDRIFAINVDKWTETFHTGFYMHYLSAYPESCFLAETCDGTVAGYLIGKAEGNKDLWHSHISALSIAPEFRRSGLAKRLMEVFHVLSGPAVLDCYFVDLFVRGSNKVALEFYLSLGYVIFRTVEKYYSGVEDAYDMRKPLEGRDPERKSVAGAGKIIQPEEMEW